MINPTLEILLAKLNATCHKAQNAARELSFYHEAQELSKSDARIATAYRITDIIGSVYLMTINLSENLEKTSWWEERNLNVLFSPTDRPRLLLNYWTFLAWGGLIVSLFSAFEAGLREIIRKIFPGKYADGASDFLQIYKDFYTHLTNEGWQFSIGDPLDLLNLYRNARNAIHNNGMHRPKNGQNEKCTWQGETYHFINGQARDFTMHFCIFLADQLIDLNLESMKAQALRIL